MDLKIIHRDVQEDGTYRLSFRLPIGAGRVSGLDGLTQIVLSHWMTTPGQDELSPDQGGGLLQAFRRFTSSGNTEQLAADIAESVSRTDKQLRVTQVGSSLASTEMLERFILQEITYQGRRATLRVQVINQAGEQATLTI